jgi:hypothetical protein
MCEKLRAWRWWIWGIYVAVWTGGLLVPGPEPVDTGEPVIDAQYVAAKAVHVGAYTAMTLLSAWLRVPLRYRSLLMFFLMVHATLTELLQYSMDFIRRSGSLLDVGLDHIGIAIGVLAAWKWWTQEDAWP